jgi:hypothetical protein
MVDMSDPGVTPRLVRDIDDGPPAPWRWTGPRPAVRIKIGYSRQMNYVIDFALPEVTFKDTGPVTVEFTVNDHVLNRVRYATPGSKHFEKAVPPDWLEPRSNVIVGAEIDPVWVSKLDGARLGFILTRIGLAEQ